MKDMVKISDLNQTFYTKDGELEVLKNINFNLIEGEILTILGPSGSGKSTILNILTDLLEPLVLHLLCKKFDLGLIF